MLGATGVQVGTRFLVAYECNIHQNYKNKILNARDTDTITTGKRLGHPVRSLKTAFSREFFKKEYDSSITDEELEKFGAGSLRLAAVEGDDKKGSFMAGQIAALVNKEQPAAEIIKEMFSQAETILNGAGKWIK
jgi:enoyl-[acyl-carrier protein] reductase II